MLEAQDDYYDGLDQAARESQQAQQAHDAALVQDGQDIAEEDKNTGHGTREAVAQELDGSPSGQAARLLVDNWLANDDAETVHEQIDGVDDSQWDAEMKQRLHEYVDAPVRAEETNSPAEGEIVLSDEVDEKGRPFVEAEDGTTVFGRITDDSGLSAAPIKLSEGFQDENTGKGYGLIHIEANHGKQIRNAGFASAKDFVSYVAANYDPNNIRVGKRRSDGSMTFLIQVTDTRDNTLFVELSKDGSYWNVNSGGIFRKGYSNKKETVAKTEPKQPNNAVSSGSSLSANDNTGISYAEPNGEPTVSTDKVTPVSSDGKTKTGENAEGKELPRDKDGNLIYDQVPVKDTVEDLYDGNMDDQEVAEFVSVQTKEAEKALAKAERSKPAITANKAKNLEAKRKWEAAVQEARRKVDYWHSVTQEIDRLTRDEGARASEATQTSETTVTGETLAARVLAGSKILPESFRKETGYGPEEQKRYVGLISNDGQTIDHLAEELVDLDNTENNGGFFAGDTYAAKEAILSALQQAGTRGELLELAQGKSTHEGLAEHEEQVRDEYYLSRYGMTYDDYQAYVEQEMPALLRRYSGYDETAFLNAYAEEIERELRARENDRTREEQGDGRSAEVLPGERTGEPAGVDESAGPRSQSETRDGSPVEEAAVREGAETEGKDAPEEKNDVSGESGSGVQEVRPLSDEEATHLLTRMEENAEEIPQLELNPSNWNAQFGEKGVVSTPVGQVKMGENQIAKLFERGRSEQFGMIKPTLEAPQVVIEVPSESIDNTTERGSSLLFVKTFIQKDGRKIYYFKSVTVRKDGLEVSVSSHYDRPKRIKDALKNGKLLYRFDGGAQTEHHPADVSVTASPKHAQGVSEARQAESEGGLFLVLPSESSKEAGGLSSRARGLSSADKVTPVSSDGEAKAEKNEVKEGKTPSSIPQNPAVQNHDWSQYKKGDVFDINGYKVRFDYVEREEDGSVRGVAVTHLDENGKPKEHGGELVPPLMFMHEFKPVKEEKKSVPTENHQRSPLNEGGQDKKMHLAERIAKALGAKLVIVDHMEENGRFTVNRRTGERTITIARDAENPLSFVFGHESLHAVRSLSEEAYKNLRDMVKAAMGEEAWNAEVAKAVEMYKGQKGYNSLGDYEEEVVAEFLGSVLNDQQRMADLARRLDRPVLSAIMDVLRKMRDWFRQDHMTAQERWTGEVLEIVENAYAQAAKTGKSRRTDSRASLRQSSTDLFEEAQRQKREEERKAAAKEIADKYGLDEALLSRYDEGMRLGNSAAASAALWDLRVAYQKEHTEERKALMEREGVNGLVANRRLFAPIEKAIKERFGDVEDLIAEHVRQAEEERKVMEAARKRAEEERQKRQARLDELAALSETEIDKQYADALERGDEALAREMLEEAARRKGYGDATSDYQGVGAWVAPSNPGYDTDQERREASKEDSIDLNVEDMAAGYSNQPMDIFMRPERYSQGLATSKESGRAIQTAIDKIKRGKKDVKVKVYRAVPTSVKEGKLRNGDWVTPSRAYAEMHGDHRLEGKYRIIEDEVPANELWWDSNDVNEWGYDNGKNYRYKNAKNNRKLNDLVTRDDKGNIIPPSKRFNSRKADERYSLRDGDSSTDLFAQAQRMRGEETALRDALTDRIRQAGIEVITDTEAGQRVLDMANGKERRMSAKKKRALETVSASQDEKHHQTAISSADGTKVLKNLDSLTKEYENSPGTKEKTFIGEVARSLQIDAEDKSSKYATFETQNGKVVTIRLSNHNATVSNFDNRGEEEGISIVITPKPNQGVTNDGKAHVTEFFYNAIKLRRADGKPLAEILRSIKQALYSGEFHDTTGLAEVQEVNADEAIRYHKAYHGSGADFDHVRFFRGQNGEAYGFTVGGKIYLDPRVATAETPIHEYTHLWATALQQRDGKAWQSVVELMKGTSVWDEVRRAYPELKTDDEVADEVLATYSGRRGAERLREEMRKAAEGKDTFAQAAAMQALDRVRKALRDFWQQVARLLHLPFTSGEGVADQVLGDLLEGKNPNGGLRPDTPVRVVESEQEHGFKNYKEAKDWAKKNIARTYSDQETGGKGVIRISNTAIDKYLSESAVAKSESRDAHLSVLKVLPNVIRESVDAEQHPDYKKNANGVRDIENGANPDVTIHRLYGAVRIGDNLYRVKVTLKEDRTSVKGPKKAYSYEATKIELLAGQHGENSKEEPSPRYSNNSISAAKLLKGVEKSYGGGKFFADYDKIREQFIGENGAASLDHAEEVTTRLDNLAVAREMEEAKKDAKTIKMATGWERGADGKWRYEIPDFLFDYNGLQTKNTQALYRMDAKDRNKFWRYDAEDYDSMGAIKKKNFKELRQKYGYKRDDELTLGDVITGKGAQELFKAYPKLRDITFTFSYLPYRTLGLFDPDTNTIELKDSYRLSDKEGRYVLLHEVQHAIQWIEGFARGGNPGAIENEFRKAKSEWRARAYAHDLEETAKELGDEYNQAEVEKALLKEYEDMDMQDWLPDEETRIKGFNYFARGYADHSLDDAIKRFRLNESTRADFDPHKEYRKLAGETEARNVQSRMNMSPENRKSSLAADTEDVAREDQIFLFGVDTESRASLRRGENRGYGVREDGTSASRRAIEAEEEGRYSAGKFRTAYKVARVDFDVLHELGAINGSEWHHTGKKFTRTPFYSWSSDGYHARYTENKKRIGELVKQYEEADWEYQKEEGLVTFNGWARHKFVVENPMGLSEREMYDSDYMDEKYEEYVNDNRAELEQGYDAYANETNARLKEAKEHNAHTNGKEAKLLEIARLLGMDIEQAKRLIRRLSDAKRPESRASLRRKASRDLFTEARMMRDEERKERRAERAARRTEAKELYANVLQGDFDDVTLQQINDFIDTVTPYEPDTRPLSKRLPPRVGLEVSKGKRTGSVDALFSRISESTVPAHERTRAEGKRRIEEKKKELLKGWAIATGNWHTSVKDFTDAKEPLGSGKDSDVYVSKDGRSVIKVSHGKENLKKFRPDVDNVALFNTVFKNSKYTILGYGEIDGKFVRFLQQPIVDFTSSTPLTPKERVDYMQHLGFQPMNEEKTAFTNGEIVASDIQGNNIVKDHDGNIRVIDADMRLHTKEVGGQFAYPPVEEDTESTDLFAQVEQAREETERTRQAEEADEDMTTKASLRRGEAEELNREGDGNITDAEVSLANDPMSRMLGQNRFTKIEQHKFAERRRKRMAEHVEELSNRLHLDNVEIITDTEELDGKRAKAKGFYNKKSGKIAVVIPNHVSVADVEKTLLHEAVAHYGLRKLFGEHFDTFLDNVYNRAYRPVRQEIHRIADEKGLDLHTATEEYLAQMAEQTDFDNAQESGWWFQISNLFMRMLHSIGFEGWGDFTGVSLSDAELRYLLWRSYENLRSPGEYKSITGKIKDDRMQERLGVGKYESKSAQENAAEESQEGDLFREVEELEEVNRKFNEQIDSLTEENADRTVLSLGRPSRILLTAGVSDKPMKLYGNKVLKKMRKHGFTLDELRDLPKAVADPVTVFNNYRRDGNRSILTDLKTQNGNFLVALELGRDGDVDFNVVSSVFGKGRDNVLDWYNQGYATYINKEKALSFLSHQSAPIAATAANEELSSAAKVVENFENPTMGKEKSSGATEKTSLRRGTSEAHDLFQEAQEMHDEEETRLSMRNNNQGSGWSRETMQQAWDNIMSRASFMAKEGYWDYLASVEEFQNLIAKATGRKVSDLENAYQAMLALSSRNANEMKLFDSALALPLQKAVLAVAGAVKDFKTGKGRALAQYLIAKHGIERNRDMAVRAALKEQAAKDIDLYTQLLSDWYDEADRIKQHAQTNGWTWRQTQEALTQAAETYGADMSTDYSGLTGMLTDEGADTLLDTASATAQAYQMVEDYEKAHDHLGDLWQAVHDISEYSLAKQHKSGLVGKEYVDDQHRRYEYYVPLRGFADPTAEDMYGYLDGQRANGGLGSPVKTAKGRTSESADPLGNLLNVAYRSIASGNKNMALQHFYNLVNGRDTSGLAVTDKMWVENVGTDTNPDWVLAEPQLTDPATGGREMTGEEVQAEMERFNADMEAKRKAGTAKQLTGGKSDPQYRIVNPGHKRSHQVRLNVGGRARVITIAGNPRVALALNGLLNPENSAWPILQRANNFMASAFTNYNVSFGLANLARDTMQSNMRAFIMENPLYWAKFTAKQGLMLGNVANCARMIKMMLDYSAGKQPNGHHEQMFKEFLEAGGATGYTMIRSQEEASKFVADLVRDLKNAKRKKLNPLRLFDLFSFLNESTELVNRFIAYETSREMGRTVERSVDDAKEATLNFNRKGAGAKSLTDKEGTKYRLANALNYYSQYGRSFIVFFNAFAQSQRQLYKMMTEHPAKFTAAFFAAPVTVAAVALPVINNLLLPALYGATGGDGDDDNYGSYYDELSDWERQHNICIRLPKGHGWIKIPLSAELATPFALGDVTGAAFNGQRDLSASDASVLLDLVTPNNINGNDVGVSLVSFLPSGAQFAGHIAINRDFKGSKLYNDSPFAKYQPNWRTATRNTSKSLVALSRGANRLAGGSDERNADAWYDWKPGYVQEMLTGLAGGWASTALAVSDAILPMHLAGGGTEKSFAENAQALFDRGGIPVVSRFVIPGSGTRNTARAKSDYLNTVKPMMGSVESELSLIKGLTKDAAKDVARTDRLLKDAEKTGDVTAIAEAQKAKQEADARLREKALEQKEKLNEMMHSDRWKAYRQMLGLTKYIDAMMRVYGNGELPANVTDSIRVANDRARELQ